MQPSHAARRAASAAGRAAAVDLGHQHRRPPRERAGPSTPQQDSPQQKTPQQKTRQHARQPRRDYRQRSSRCSTRKRTTRPPARMTRRLARSGNSTSAPSTGEDARPQLPPQEKMPGWTPPCLEPAPARSRCLGTFRARGSLPCDCHLSSAYLTEAPMTSRAHTSAFEVCVCVCVFFFFFEVCVCGGERCFAHCADGHVF